MNRGQLEPLSHTHPMSGLSNPRARWQGIRSMCTCLYKDRWRTACNPAPRGVQTICGFIGSSGWVVNEPAKIESRASW